MASSEKTSESRLYLLQQLCEGLLQSAGPNGIRGDILEIHHPHAPPFDPGSLRGWGARHGLSISLCQGGQPGSGQPVSCASTQLPFQDRVFSVVLLNNVVGQGAEEELSEAVRVLARDGLLLLLGLNRMGWRYRAQDDIRRLPGIAPLRVKSRLEQLGMTMRDFAGAGLAGRQRPACMRTGLTGLAIPLADVVLLQARHCDSREVTPLSLRKTRSSVVQSAPIRG